MGYAKYVEASYPKFTKDYHEDWALLLAEEGNNRGEKDSEKEKELSPISTRLTEDG